jgi:DNA invertase Pin-like site-specific DNA recombinase
MTEHAIAIARVSAGKQAEEDQEPGLRKYADSKDYTLDTVVRVHGKSAFHGRHVKHILAAVDKYVKKGNATVVIFRDVDRSSRQGAQATFDLRGTIIRAGARMEFSGQEYLNDQRNQEMLLGLLATAAREESETKSRRKLQGNGVKRTNGELIGRAPWGYDYVFDATGKIRVNIKPNALGAKWIPQIFDAAINGKSLTAICRMLDGVPSPQGNGLWDDATIRRLINRKTYYGLMRGNPNMEFDSLVTVEQWQQANLAVASRFKRGRGPSSLPPSFVKPFCGACYGIIRDEAPSGKSPMYRTTGNGKAYYTCKGHGPARKGCGGPGIPVTELDAAVDHVMRFEPQPHMTRKFVAGDDNSERLAAINEKIAAAFAAGNYPLMTQLSQEAAQIEPSKRKGTVELVDSGLTIGQHWQTLTPEGKRDELAAWTVIAGLETSKTSEVFVNHAQLGATVLSGRHGNVLVLLIKRDTI